MILYCPDVLVIEVSGMDFNWPHIWYSVDAEFWNPSVADAVNTPTEDFPDKLSNKLLISDVVPKEDVPFTKTV